MGASYRNIYGRKAGRGVRPWLLVPKVMCVGVYFGGLVGLAVVGNVECMERLFKTALFVGATGAVAMGILLVLQHPGALLRMRWLRVKLAVIVLGLPVAHWSIKTALDHAGGASDQVAAEGAMGEAWRRTIVAVVLAGVVITLGRLKPRLGQDLTKIDYRPKARVEDDAKHP